MRESPVRQESAVLTVQRRYIRRITDRDETVLYVRYSIAALKSHVLAGLGAGKATETLDLEFKSCVYVCFITFLVNLFKKLARFEAVANVGPFTIVCV